MNRTVLTVSENFSGIKLIVATVGGFIANALGGIDTLLTTLITLMVLDYVTGVIRAIYKKELSSSEGFKGIIKKVFILLTVSLSVSLGNVLPNGIPLREITVLFFIANEGVSILENAAGIIPLPGKLSSVLALIEKKSEDLAGEDEEIETNDTSPKEK